MPYRIDLPHPPHDALDTLLALGALDVEVIDDGLAAILPDAVSYQEVRGALGGADYRVSAARGRDDGSVWILRPRPFQVGGLRVAPATIEPGPSTLRHDTDAFGTGLHPTTALCIESIEAALPLVGTAGVLDVGVGSGVLALAALLFGVARAVGVDVDRSALDVAGANAVLNGLSDRLTLVHGGPDLVSEAFPLVLANVLPAPLIDLAPTLVRRVGHHGRLVLSGVPVSIAPDVERTYVRLGMRRAGVDQRDGWSSITLDASW